MPGPRERLQLQPLLHLSCLNLAVRSVRPAVPSSPTGPDVEPPTAALSPVVPSPRQAAETRLSSPQTPPGFGPANFTELLAEEPSRVLCVCSHTADSLSWPSTSALSLWSCVGLDSLLDVSEFRVLYKVGGG